MKESVKKSYEILNGFHADAGKSCICGPRRFSEEFDLDIVVPCYNSESTLKDCVDSIISQETDHSFRLILIDDGSKDGTGSIIDSYMQTVRRPEITAIHQQNKGHSGARNAGLDILNSKYVMFVDSDDKLYSPNSLQTLLDTAFSFDADIVEGGAHHMKNHQLQSKDLKPSGRIGVSDLRGMPWGKVIRSSFFGNIEFPENYWYEDSIMAQIIYPSADPEKIYGVDEVVYLYNINPGSVSVKGRKSNKCLDSLWITLRLFNDRGALGIEKSAPYFDYILRMSQLTYSRIALTPAAVKSAFLNVYSDFINREFENVHSAKYPELEKALREDDKRSFRRLFIKKYGLLRVMAHRILRR